MQSRSRELARAHGLHTALKVKDSKTGKVILKDNVFEDSKLEEEINHIKQWQKKEASRLRWEKEYAIKGMRKNLLRRGKSNPEILNLPPIEEGGFKSRHSKTTRMSKKKRFLSMEDSSCDADSSPELSPYSSVEDIRVKPRVMSSISQHVCYSEITILPALLSPHLIRKSNIEDSTNDPRFRKLLQNLVPKPEVKN
ncbi:hypothetical protein OS493_001186 [Desmophyllum pertusum]|uniref:Uncharacterized protein n=1 Tax=Desmophyllum pertusum TaxID=174260 RepID=A0A9X0D7K8_9CNID|nr:hypothetical protein OS493_001186 [Desmophyllum pertusum]